MQGPTGAPLTSAALTQGRDLLIRNPGREAETAREDLLGEKTSSDFWILMRAWSYAVNNQFRIDACRKLGIHAVTAKQVGPLFEQFLRIAKDEGLDTLVCEKLGLDTQPADLGEWKQLTERLGELVEEVENV